MHPRESIPNVGRRARGHRAATFTLKGSGVSASSTTTTTKNITTAPKPQRSLQPSETDDVNNVQSHVRERCMDYSLVEGEEGVGGGEGPVHLYHQDNHQLHHHPYGRIPHRITYRRQTNIEHQHHNASELDPPDDYVPSTTRTTNRTSRNASNVRPHRPPQNRASRADGQQTVNSRWQGSKTMRRSQRSEEKTQQVFHRQRRSEERPKVDLSGGFLTGRNPAGHPDSDADTRSEVPDTTRSEPADVSTASREARKPLPQLVRTGNATSALDELLDYYWVYQGMGRQVLNLDLPQEVWDRKMFRKPVKLPPITTSQEDSVTDMIHGLAGHPSQRSQKTTRRRAISEPASLSISPRSQFSGVSGSFVKRRLGESGSGSNDLSLMFDQKSSPVGKQTQGLETSDNKMKLVVKMPVLTKDLTRADLGDND